jgi:DinB family protein
MTEVYVHEHPFVNQQSRPLVCGTASRSIWSGLGRLSNTRFRGFWTRARWLRDHVRMKQTIDPVAMPDAYRQSLLAALGEDDPAVAQAQTPTLITTLIRDAGDLIRARPAPGEWSALECIGHLTDSELVVSARYRWILAENEPDIVGYDQALWVSELAHEEADPAVLAQLFGALRRENINLWSRRPIADRDRIGRHRERGPESYGLTFRLAAGHDRVHVAQAREALAHVSREAATR